MNELAKNELDELEELLYALVNANTKSVGKEIRKKLEFKASSYYERLDPYVRGKLKEAINYAGEASGQDREKAHWELQSQQSWYVFRSNISKTKNNE